MKIFLSYGHDENSDLALKLKSELEDAGFQVWMDENEIKTTHDWEISIEKGIESCEWVVVMMTPHSMRRPDGVCLDEISYARFQNKNIAPIMIQMVQPPLTIARIQWLDMQESKDRVTGEIIEAIFREKFNLLLDAIKGNFHLGFEGEISDLNRRLKPIENSIEIYQHTKNFIGRKSLLKHYKDWLLNSNSNVLWIVGGPGTGKTALSSYLCYSEATISCYHFFKFKDSDRHNAKKAISSIAYYMATQIPQYLHNLCTLSDLDKLEGKSISALFKYLIVNPLNGVVITGEKKVILFDALDEIDPNQQQDFINTIVQNSELLPSWLGIVITSRPEPDIKRRLSKFNPIEIDLSSDENKLDISTYIETRLNTVSENSLANLVSKSEGNFLFVKEFLDQLESGNISLSDVEQLPNGLSSLYTFYFERQFSNYDNYKKLIRPLLEIICAANIYLNFDQVSQIIHWDEYEQEETIEELGSLFIIETLFNSDGSADLLNNKMINEYLSEKQKEDLQNKIKKKMEIKIIRPFHKSIIDWLLSSEKSGKYRVSFKKGHERIFDTFWLKYQNQGTEELTAEEFKLLINSIKELNKWTELEILFCDPSLLNIHNPCQKVLRDYYKFIEYLPSDTDFTNLKRIPFKLVELGWKTINDAGSWKLDEYREGIRYFYRGFVMLYNLEDPTKVVWVFDLIKENTNITGFFHSGASDVNGEEGDVLRFRIREMSIEMISYLKEEWNIDTPKYVDDWIVQLKFINPVRIE